MIFTTFCKDMFIDLLNFNVYNNLPIVFLLSFSPQTGHSSVDLTILSVRNKMSQVLDALIKNQI